MAARVIQIAPKSISQREIEEMLCLEKRIRSLTEQYNAIAADLMARVERGCPVEPGLYRLAIRERTGAGQCLKRLVVL